MKVHITDSITTLVAALIDSILAYGRYRLDLPESALPMPLGVPPLRGVDMVLHHLDVKEQFDVSDAICRSVRSCQVSTFYPTCRMITSGRLVRKCAPKHDSDNHALLFSVFTLNYWSNGDPILM